MRFRMTPLVEQTDHASVRLTNDWLWRVYT